MGDPSYPDAEPAQVAVVVSDRVYPFSLYRPAYLPGAGAYPVPDEVDSDLAALTTGAKEGLKVIHLLASFLVLWSFSYVR